MLKTQANFINTVNSGILLKMQHFIAAINGSNLTPDTQQENFATVCKFGTLVNLFYSLCVALQSKELSIKYLFSILIASHFCRC